LVVATIFAAAVLSSLAPPSKALASVGNASAHVGPGRVAETVKKNGYSLRVAVAPNRAALPNSFAVSITKGGKPVRHAAVLLSFAMLDMQMQNQEYRLEESAPGVYSRAAPALVMVGHWGLSFNVTPPGGTPFDVLLVDRANG
jgi:copper transport protein